MKIELFGCAKEMSFQKRLAVANIAKSCLVAFTLAGIIACGNDSSSGPSDSSDSSAISTALEQMYAGKTFGIEE